ncbi:MAG TPA: glycosyltransferase family 39 protein [Xanthobacteraceae bacterium]|nr:glycosyltransferase family 39 protein [Xanthobacteraceae bacterium]
MECRDIAARSRIATREPWDIATALLLAALALLVACTFRQYSISNDEGVQQRYGELIIAYYASGFHDRALFAFDNLYLYGGLFDVAATLLAKIVPLDLYDLRHLLCACTGLGGIAATWATARMIAGPRAGFIAAALLAVSGPWYGTMFNHTKDIPFAAAMIGATGMLVRIARDLPRARPRDLALFGLLLGAALGLRVLGLMMLAYVPLAAWIGLSCRAPDARRRRAADIVRVALAFAPALLLAYLIMIAAWPWSALALFNPIRALVAFSDFHYPIRTLLDGHVYQMADVPRWYVPVYLLIRLPLITVMGVALGLMFEALPRAMRAKPLPRTRYEIGLIALTALFPPLCHVVVHGPAFTGLRHFLFVVPALTVLAAIGWDAALARLAQWRRAATLALAGVMAAVTWDGVVLARLHPYEYLDYNELVGGLPGAAGRYATDYWVEIMPEALDRLEQRLAREQAQGGHAGPYYVAVCAERTQFDNTPHGTLRFTKDVARADFFIAPTHMNCDRSLPGQIIVKIERLGTLIGVVKDRRAITRPGLAQNHTWPAPPLAQ